MSGYISKPNINKENSIPVFSSCKGSAAGVLKGLNLRSPFLINSQFLSHCIYFALSKANITVKKLPYKHNSNASVDWNGTSTTGKQNSMQRRVKFPDFSLCLLMKKPRKNVNMLACLSFSVCSWSRTNKKTYSLWKPWWSRRSCLCITERLFKSQP